MKQTTQIGTDLGLAADFLKNGKLVAIPTETVYGLAGNALDADAVLSIFSAKARPAFDPLIVHIGDFEQLQKFVAKIPRQARQLAQLFWPGPLTILFEKSALIPDIVTSGHQTVAVRIPNHPLTLQLLQQLDFPLAAPSANPFGYVSPTSAQHVYNQLNGKLPYILDGGQCSVGLESTIISFVGDTPKVLRLGGLPLDALETALDQKVEHQLSSSNPKAPGMLLSHYNPGKKVVLDALPEADESTFGYIRFNALLPNVSADRQIVLSCNGDLNEAAKNLFSTLRFFDDKRFELVFAERVPSTGIGLAINDRLTRAASLLNNQ